ncbi:MAG TPA: TIR domain-containing protein [Candidatus Binatia bacterium]|nr:TIR domain-containing protein [Candidatus Binatia bacterium]
MNDIFISYDSADRAIAQKFADALESRGWSVWWDREIPLGKAFDQVIEEELNAARCVIVLWSNQSVRSRWVKTEAAAAADRDCLLPVLIEDIAIPFEFKRIQTAMLMNWRGDDSDPEFDRLVRAIEHLVKEPARPASSRPAIAIDPAPWLKPTGRWIIPIALVALVIAGTLALRSFARRSDPPPQQVSSESAKPAANQTQSAGSAAPSPEPFADARKSAMPQGAFPIKIGDKIADGVPAPGAGIIETPYEHDVYVFKAAARQRVYFRLLGRSTGMDYINWKLIDADGTEVFKACLGCSEVGVRALNKGGTYTLTIGNDKDPATGTYQFQLFDVPAPNQFSIKIGDQIKEDVPAPGAGIIESPGAQDIYTFEATPRQKVYFRAWEHSAGMSYIKWRLTDSAGMEVFDTCLGCGEPGVQTLTKGGSYSLAVGHESNPATGTYRLQLYDVPLSKQFSIKIGDRIRPGIPTKGAGTIESPGTEDVYVFSATPGQKVSFRITERSQGMDYINWRLVDDNGMELFNSCLACGERGMQTLSKGGTYTLTIGNTRHPATGDYGFEIGAP